MKLSKGIIFVVTLYLIAQSEAVDPDDFPAFEDLPSYENNEIGAVKNDGFLSYGSGVRYPWRRYSERSNGGIDFIPPCHRFIPRKPPVKVPAGKAPVTWSEFGVTSTKHCIYTI